MVAYHFHVHSDNITQDPSAATALLQAHRNPPLRPRSTSTSLATPQSPGAKHDRLGRRIVRPSPSLPRQNSSSSNSLMRQDSATSGVEETDEDLRRARTLLELLEQRGRLKQMGDTGLLRSKERVDVVAARYAERDLQEKNASSLKRVGNA